MDRRYSLILLPIVKLLEQIRAGSLDGPFVKYEAYVLKWVLSFRTVRDMKNNAEALADSIVELSKKGVITTPFRVRDLTKHCGEFAKSHLDTVLANYEESGYMVRQRGLRARFRRVGRIV